MVQRIIQVALRDIKNSFRDPMVLYIMFSPMLLAVLLLAVTPEQDRLSVSFALAESVPSSTVVGLALIPITLSLLKGMKQPAWLNCQM